MMTDNLVMRLRRDLASGLSASVGDTKDAADEIERLTKKCDAQATILQHLSPDRFPNIPFIHGTLGDKDQNGMPEKLMVIPALGVDFSYIYERTEKTTGPEW
jgi:hypothetical protein